MGRIKNNDVNIKIKKKTGTESIGCSSKQYPWFSFHYMTRNSKYSFKFLDSLDTNDREKILTGLFAKLEELSKQPWVYWQGMKKRAGLETINLDQLNFSANDDDDFTKETKVFVFQFASYQGSHSGRILGVKLSPCSVLHIIGFDFDFSAYKH